MAGGCRDRPPPPEFQSGDVRVRVGIGDARGDRHWSELRLLLRNRGGDFRGVLRIRGQRDGFPEPWRDPVTYRMDLEIPGKGAPREIAFPVWPRGWDEVEVTLEQDGASWGRVFPLPPGSPWSRGRALVVSPRWRDLDALLETLKAKAESYQWRGENLRFEGVLARPAELSPHVEAYDPFAVLILDGASLSDGAPEVLHAIRRWVERGGVLVSFPGPEWESGLREELRDLLGVDPGDPAETLPADIAILLGARDMPGFYRAVKPRPGTELWQGGLGLAYQAPRGTGWAVTFTFNPVGSFPSATDAEGIHEILQRFAQRAFSPAENSREWLQALEQQAPWLLSDLAGISAPRASSVALGLAVYLLLGFLVPAVILRRLRRREWTFAVVIVAAAASAVGIYRYGLLSSRTGTELYELTVLRLQSGHSRAEATSFLGVISSRPARLALAVPDPVSGEALLRPIPIEAAIGPRSMPAQASRLEELEISAGPEGHLALPEIALYPGGMQYFRCDYRVAVDDLALVHRFQGGALGSGAALTNRGKNPIQPRILRGNQYQRHPEVVPGETKRIQPEPGKWVNTRGDPSSWNPMSRFYLSARQAASGDVRQLVLGTLSQPGRTSLVASTRTAVYPGGDEIARHEAWTLLVLDLGPEP